MPSLNLGILASHTGTNFQAILDACNQGRLDATCRVVISNNSGCIALRRARSQGVPGFHLSTRTHPSPTDLDLAIANTMTEHQVDTVVLAGYMKLLGPITLTRYRGRILNIHPALLPEFGGRGMHGDNVHSAVLASGEKFTGVTIHLVDDMYDHGQIIAQSKVPVLEQDSVESLRTRVLEREHEFYVETLQKIISGEIRLPAKP